MTTVVSGHRTFFLKWATANISSVRKRQVRSMNEYVDIGFFGTDVRRPPECGSRWRVNERVAANRNESSGYRPPIKSWRRIRSTSNTLGHMAYTENVLCGIKDIYGKIKVYFTHM